MVDGSKLTASWGIVDGHKHHKCVKRRKQEIGKS